MKIKFHFAYDGEMLIVEGHNGGEALDILFYQQDIDTLRGDDIWYEASDRPLLEARAFVLNDPEQRARRNGWDVDYVFTGADYKPTRSIGLCQAWTKRIFKRIPNVIWIRRMK